MERYYKKNLFVAPAAYFIKNLEGQEKESFKNVVFQYDNMVCGMVDDIDYINKRFSVTFKVTDKNYNYPIVTLSIDCYGVDLSKFHCVKVFRESISITFSKLKSRIL